MLAMTAKLLIVGLLLGIVLALMAAAVFLVRDPSQSRRSMRALTLRVGLQVALVLFLLLAVAMGWIKPHGIGG
jgi:Mg/Co/Ni transporter MgtE